MSDETPEETPEPELSQEAINDFLAAAAQDLNHDTTTEAWMILHEMYNGLLAGGFEQKIAVEILVSYMVKIMGESTGGL